MPYPTIGEYKDAIRLAEHSFGNLTHLRPEYDATGDLHFSSGNFAVVFKMRDTRTNRPVAVKCFVREQPLRRQRYAQISACLDALPYSPYLLRYTYHPAEIWVETALSEQREFEVVTLDWVEGQTLYNYLQSRCDAGDSIALRKVAEAFDRLATWLLAQPFAHGDLKPDNILVTPRGELVLVDYDGMFTPDMAGEEATELGSPAFRHPRRSLRDFGKYIDHVPILVLSLSLHVLAEHPDWLGTYYQGDNLILTANDLGKPDSPIFHTIRSQCRAWTTQNRLQGLVNALISPTLGDGSTYLQPLPNYDEIKLIPYVKYFKDGNKKWGYCDENKNVVIDFISDNIYVYDFWENLLLVEKNGKKGFINKTGQEVIPYIYDNVYNFSEGMALVGRNGKKGFINKTGQEVVPCIYDNVYNFSEGMALVGRNGKKGFVNKTGQEVVPCIYDNIYNFSDGMARVEKNKKISFIDKTGRDNAFSMYENAGDFNEGMARVEKNKKWGFVDETGIEAITCIYDWVNDFKKGLAYVRKNKKWGIINKIGQEIKPCIYDTIGEFYKGISKVSTNHKYGFIDNMGYEITPCIYKSIGDLNEGMARVEINKKWNSFDFIKWGFVDETGKEVIPCIYGNAQNFCDGFAKVLKLY